MAFWLMPITAPAPIFGRPEVYGYAKNAKNLGLKPPWNKDLRGFWLFKGGVGDKNKKERGGTPPRKNQKPPAAAGSPLSAAHAGGRP